MNTDLLVEIIKQVVIKVISTVLLTSYEELKHRRLQNHTYTIEQDETFQEMYDSIQKIISEMGFDFSEIFELTEPNIDCTIEGEIKEDGK
jgi:hypothetical protein